MSVQPDDVEFQEEFHPFDPFDKADTRSIERFADYEHYNVPERNMDLSIINNRRDCPDLEECLRGIGSNLSPCEPIYAESSYTHQVSRSLERTWGRSDIALSYPKTSSDEPHVTLEQRSMPHAHDVSVSLDRDCVMVPKHTSMAGCEPWHPPAIIYTDRPSNPSPGTMYECITGITAIERNLKDLSTSHQISSDVMSEISGPGDLNHSSCTTWNFSAIGQDTTDTSFPPDMMDYVATSMPASGPISVQMKNSQAAQLLGVPDHLCEPPSPTITVPPSEVTRILVCPQKDCSVGFTGKYRQGNLLRNVRLKHDSKEGRYLCEQEDCGKTFKRQDVRLKHYRKTHAFPSKHVASTVRANKMEGMTIPTSSESFPYPDVSENILSPENPCSPGESAAEPETLPYTVDGCSFKDTGAHQYLSLNHAQKGETFYCEARGCAESFQQADARLKHYRIHHHDLAIELSSSHSGHKPSQTAFILDDMISTKLDKMLPEDRATIQSVTPGSRYHSSLERSGENSKTGLEANRTYIPKWRSTGCPEVNQDEASSNLEFHSLTTLQPNILGHDDLKIGPNHHDSPLSEVDIPDESDTDERSTSGSSNDSKEQVNMVDMVDELDRIRLSDWLAAVISQAHGNSPKGSSSTPVSSDTSASRSTFATSTSAGSKRSVHGLPDDDPGGNKRRKRRPRIMLDDGEVAQEMYACPFPKKDPRRHTRCWEYAFEKSKFPNLKQHFKRHHLIPFHCPRCGLEFTGDDKDAERDRHLRQQPQCPRVDLIGRWNGITADQWRRIKKTKQRTITEHDYWMHVYDILFSSQPISGHPYHEDYKALEVRILIGTISSAITNNLIPFLTAQGLFANLTDATQTDLTNNLQKLVAAGVNTGFDIAGIEVDRTPPCLPLQELSVSATVPERRDPNDGLFVHASGSLSEESRSPYDMMESVHSDAPTAINKDPHAGPSKDTMAAIQNVQRNDTLGIMNNCSRTCLSNKFTAAQLDFQLSNALSTMTDGLHVRSCNNTLAAIPFIQRNDILTTMNEDPHAAPSDAITDAEQDTQGGKDSPAWNNDANPPFDSSTFIDWDSSDHYLFGEYVTDGPPPDGDIPDIDE